MAGDRPPSCVCVRGLVWLWLTGWLAGWVCVCGCVCEGGQEDAHTDVVHNLVDALSPC